MNCRIEYIWEQKSTKILEKWRICTTQDISGECLPKTYEEQWIPFIEVALFKKRVFISVISGLNHIALNDDSHYICIFTGMCRSLGLYVFFLIFWLGRLVYSCCLYNVLITSEVVNLNLNLQHLM